MKKRVIAIAFILIIISVSILEIVKLNKEKKEVTDNNVSTSVNETTTEGKDTSKEEYIYKEELLTLKYSVEEINLIEKKIDSENVKKYLLEKKYNNLISFMNSEYFNIENIERYQNYYDKNSYKETEAVLYVEMNLDKEFYSDIKKSNVSDGKLILVNKFNAIDSDFDADLVKMDSKYGTGKMNKEAYTYFKKMVDAAAKDEITLKGISNYRSYSDQKSIYNSYKKKDGQAKADTYSARPGHSEHQTGLASDINTCSSKRHFENTKEYEWLINNSYKYGFILRYPEGKTFITGYKYEPWHYRYVGVEVATKVYEEQITYEEYYFKYM